MPRFYLLDSWLANAKGHNFQYALDVAGAAQQRGYEPILGVQKCLTRDIQFPASWRIERVFSYGECPRHWMGLDGRNPHPCDLSGDWLPSEDITAWQRLLHIFARHDRRRRIRRYSDACRKLFRAFPPRREDLLFLPSVTEFDFLCAARFWHDESWTKDFDWHLLFHFNFFTGRDPEFNDQQPMLRRFQRQFREAVDRIPQHRLHFYATSEAVARQYDSLGIAIFHPLPYPVRSLSQTDEPPATISRKDRPLRVTLAGGMRHEKGKSQLKSLLESVWDEFLEPGRLQFVFQTNAKTLASRVPNRSRGPIAIQSVDDNNPTAPLLTAPHPLDAKRYDELIRGSDIGLFAYDGRRYFSRVSGVLCEMLSAGVPVIVPAGCWLAEQLADEQQRHVENLWRQWSRERPITRFNGTNQGRLQNLGDTVKLGLVRVHTDLDSLPGPGTFMEIRFAAGKNSGTFEAREILSIQDGATYSAVRIPASVRDLEMTVRNAYDSKKLDVTRIEVLWQNLPSETMAPVSRVGLVAADDREIPRLLREMTTHHEHYRRTAHEFAHEWQRMHSPECTLTAIASRTQFDLPTKIIHAA